MTARRLRLFDPRLGKKDKTGITLHRDTLAWLEECRAWLLQQLWSNKELRPQGWDGKLNHDEAVRLIIHGFAQAYGVPLNSDKREEVCDPSD